MTLKRTLIVISLFIISVIITSGYLLYKESKEDNYLIEMGSSPEAPTSLYIYSLVEKYANEYKVPKYIVYNVFYLETTYRGPFDWSYNPYRVSPVGAQGIGQIMPSTAKYLVDKKITEKQLRNDLDLNIRSSCEILSKLHKKYGRWDRAIGCYNTGRPIVNEYARYVTTNLDYKRKWIPLNKNSFLNKK